LAHTLWRHRRTQAMAMAPQLLQRLVLPVVVLIGHVLGKYRGDKWPGSPASCPGAREISVMAAHHVECLGSDATPAAVAAGPSRAAHA
jgi:hypothetical protein